MRAITSLASANQFLCTKPSLYICSVSISFKFFLWWHDELFKHILREKEETGCFDFRLCAEGDLGQGHRDYSKQYLQPPLWNPCVPDKPIWHRRLVKLSGQRCVKLAKNRQLQLCLSVGCKFGLLVTNQLQDLLCDVLQKITGQWSCWQESNWTCAFSTEKPNGHFANSIGLWPMYNADVHPWLRI